MKTCVGNEGQEASERLLKASAGKEAGASHPSNFNFLTSFVWHQEHTAAHHETMHAERMNLQTHYGHLTIQTTVTYICNL